jgi:hypothetical protein
MKKPYLSKIINFLVLAMSTIFSLIILEITLAKFDIPPKQPLRYLFLSKPNIKDQKTSFGFYPNIIVREASVFEIKNKFIFEYDYLFKTNNLGLVQTNPVIPGKKSIILIGNSFTQGEGTIPWFYQLEENWQSKIYQIINLGIMGTGLQQWFDTLNWFNNIAPIKQIYIIFISDDWLRKRWYAEENSGLYFVPIAEDKNINKQRKSTHIYFINRNMDQQTILKKAYYLKSSSENFSNISSYKSLYVYRAIGRLRVRIGAIRRKLFGLEEMDISDVDKYELNKSKDNFNKIVTYYKGKNIFTVHLPTREEVIGGKYNYYGRLIRKFIISKNISYIDGLKLCGLSKDDFYKYDGHPNTSGYTKIRKLIENLLKDQTPKEGED